MASKLHKYYAILVAFTDKRLREVSMEVDFNDEDDVVAIGNVLRELFYNDKKAQGYALPQIGVNKRAIIIRRKGKTYLMYNPVIVHKMGSKESIEGCESLPKVNGCREYYTIKRPIFTKVVWYESDGSKKSRWFGWKFSRIIAHECDHLDGKLICDGGTKWWGNSYVQKTANKS